jgi:hypothetical protein
MLTSKTNKVYDHIYYDVSLKNTSNVPIVAKLFENRSSALIQCPSDYYYSCIRFQIPTAYLPLFVFPNNGSIPDNNYYTVGIHYYTGVQGAYSNGVSYVPFNDSSPISDPAYFFVYSFQQFVDAINTAFLASYTALKTANGGATVTTPPFITYDPTTSLFALNCETAYESANYGIFMNYNLFGFFDNFEVIRYTSPTRIVNEDVKFLIKNNGKNSSVALLPPSGGSIAGVYMTQEYKSLFNWYDVRNIVFVSNTVGVADEAINVVNNGIPNTGNTYRKILTDFQLDIDQIPRSYLQYIPVGEYRLISLTSSSPMYLFDVDIYFKTGNQTLYPLYIYPNETIDIKNLFRSRNFKSGGL